MAKILKFTPKPKYYLFLHDGTMSGDCSEATIPLNDTNITWSDVEEIMETREMVVYGGWAECIEDVDDDLFEDYMDCNGGEGGFKGGWIVPADIEAKFVQAAEFIEDPGNDGAAYALQSMWKGFYKAFAVKSIGAEAIKDPNW